MPILWVSGGVVLCVFQQENVQCDGFDGKSQMDDNIHGYNVER